MDRLDDIVRAVTRAVHQRLGGVELDLVRDDLVETVTREVLAALPPAASGGASPAKEAVSNGDGTATTGLGSVVPWPEDCLPLTTCVSCVEQQRRSTVGSRAVVTATGPNRRGVIATLTARIAEVGGDIQDVSQTIVADFFTLIFIVDLQHLEVTFAGLKERTQTAAEELGIHVVVMHEDVMRALQRV